MKQALSGLPFSHSHYLCLFLVKNPLSHMNFFHQLVRCMDEEWCHYKDTRVKSEVTEVLADSTKNAWILSESSDSKPKISGRKHLALKFLVHRFGNIHVWMFWGIESFVLLFNHILHAETWAVFVYRIQISDDTWLIIQGGWHWNWSMSNEWLKIEQWLVAARANIIYT